MSEGLLFLAYVALPVIAFLAILFLADKIMRMFGGKK